MDVRRLVDRLDLPQKIAQIQGIVPMDLLDLAALSDPAAGPPDLTKGFPYDVERLPEVRPHGVGHLSLGWQLSEDLDQLRLRLQRFQEIARDLNPLGIGVMVHAEGISGLVHPRGHQFTTAWGQAASWDPEVPRTVALTAAHQARSLGIHALFSPLLDIARDIRWGRVHETYGEDVELVSRMGVGFVRGAHGADVLATGKHFLGYGHSVGALNQASTQLGRRELVDVYAEPFRRAIDEAGLSLVMNSYNDIDGVPAAADAWTFRELLRDQMGFDGLVVSDYGSITMLLTTYRIADTPGQAAAIALRAGIDVELPSNAMTSGLAELVEGGTFPEEILNEAVERVLLTKARLGLVPGSPPPAPTAPQRPPSVDTNESARRVAAASVTLLANDGVLPLDALGGRILVTGPAADEVRIHFGAYSSVADAEFPVAIAKILAGEVPGVSASPDVFPDLFQTRLPGVEPAFEAQARQLHPEAVTVVEALRDSAADVVHLPCGSLVDPEAELDLDALEAAAAEASVIVVVVGERTGWVGNHTAGEGRTVADPVLPGNQPRLVEALAEQGKPLVTVVVSGRPLLLEHVHDASNAVVLAPLLAQFAGPTIAGVLSGAIEPTGRIPSTFPRHLGQVPLYHGHPTGSGYDHPSLIRHGYVDLPDSSPLYPFGHGLSYTEFELNLESAYLDGHTVHVTATVTNSGHRPGTALVQLYARDESASVVRPVRQLADFCHVRTEPGETATANLSFGLERLSYTMIDGRRGLEAGPVTLLLGLSSSDIHGQATLEVPDLNLTSRA